MALTALFKGTDVTVDAVVGAALKIGKAACAGREKAFVALNLGPTGKLLAPYGDLPFEEAVDIYGEMVRSGAKHGADLILIETMSDTYEIKAAILAAKENSDLPIIVTLTFDEDGKLLTGADVLSAVAMVEGLGVDAVGFNAAWGPSRWASCCRSFWLPARCLSYSTLMRGCPSSATAKLFLTWVRTTLPI